MWTGSAWDRQPQAAEFGEDEPNYDNFFIEFAAKTANSSR